MYKLKSTFMNQHWLQNHFIINTMYKSLMNHHESDNPIATKTQYLLTLSIVCDTILYKECIHTAMVIEKHSVGFFSETCHVEKPKHAIVELWCRTQLHDRPSTRTYVISTKNATSTVCCRLRLQNQRVLILIAFSRLRNSSEC